MPISIQVDQVGNGPAQRAKVYRGAINVTTPSSTSIAFAMFARELIKRRSPAAIQSLLSSTSRSTSMRRS